MMTIYKYKLEVTDEQYIMMHKNAQILSVQVQDGHPMVWALVYINDPMEKREFFTYGTGHAVELYGQTFLGTYQLNNGSLVFHVFYL